MRKFLIKILLVFALFVSLNALILFLVPKDENAYLRAYLDKIELIKTSPSPRIIFIGGSNVAFGIDSKMITDSLNINVVNFGLQAGVGIRYMAEDAINYVRKGDVVVFQFEYENFSNGGYGDPFTFTNFMYDVDFRHFNSLPIYQKISLCTFPWISKYAIYRLLKYPFSHDFSTMKNSQGAKFKYVRSGFNKFGDEVDHRKALSSCWPLELESKKCNDCNDNVDDQFVDWLDGMICKYRSKGVDLYLLPPVTTESNFAVCYSTHFSKILERHGLHYSVNPELMVLDDTMIFDGGYHINAEGVEINTQKIIKIFHRYEH